MTHLNETAEWIALCHAFEATPDIAPDDLILKAKRLMESRRDLARQASTQPAQTGGEWRVEAEPIHGWQIIDSDGRKVVGSIYYEEDAARIVHDHRKITVAREQGSEWTLNDWKTWHQSL